MFRGAALDFSVRFSESDDSLSATFSAPDLLLLDLPLDAVHHDGSTVRFTTPDDHPLQFAGVMEGDSIHGTALAPVVPGVVGRDDAGSAVRFTLRRARRSDSPYSVRAARFVNGGVTLTGNMWIPRNARPPLGAIVLLPGSSSTRRDSYGFQAERFARMGLVVMAWDKRGTGHSEGDASRVTFDDLASDAAAAVEWLRRQPEVAGRPVGLWGISQGAFIAPMVARRTDALAFIVAISPPGIPIGDCAAYQDSVRLRNDGFPIAVAARAAELNRRISRWLRTGEDESTLAAELERVRDKDWRRATSLPETLPDESVRRGWYWSGRVIDPVPLWRTLRVPVLAVWGAADELMPAAPCAAAIESALRAGGYREFTTRVFPHANHVLRKLPLEAGGTWDWPRVVPGYLELERAWVLDRLSHAKAGG